MSTITQFPSGNTQYRIEFDYLARTFVVVTLVNSSNPTMNSVLEVGRDYRFLNPTMIEMLVDQSGFDIVRIHRQTGTDLVVDFRNGSVLTASDLTNAELQAIHIAEEGRDQTVDLAKEYADAAGSSAANAKDSEDEARRIAESIKASGRIGYITRRSFEKGFNVTTWNEVLLWEEEGDYYRWDGALPKNVPAGSTPETSGGIGLGAWVSVGDASLRSNLADNNGSSLVGHQSTVNGETTVSSELKFLADSDSTIISDASRVFYSLNALKSSPYATNGKTVTLITDGRTVTYDVTSSILGNANVDKILLDNGLYAVMRSSVQNSNFSRVGSTAVIGNVRFGDLQYEKRGHYARLLNDLNIYRQPLSATPTYVDPINGNDVTGTGVSWDTAYKTLSKALTGGNNTIYVRGNCILPYEANLSSYTVASNWNIIAVGGPVISGCVEQGSWGEANGLNVFTPTVTGNTPVAVFDTGSFSHLYGYERLTQVSTLALCQSTPSSWFRDSSDGYKVYVHTKNGETVYTGTNRIVVHYARNNYSFVWSGNYRVYFEGFRFFGTNNIGTSGGVLKLSSDGTFRQGVFYAKNCEFSCAYDSAANGLSALDIGIVITENCAAHSNRRDGFNYHEGPSGVSPHFIEVNNIACGNGYLDTASGQNNNNGSTAHETAKGVRINCTYSGSRGPAVKDIDETVTYNAAITTHDSIAGFVVTDTDSRVGNPISYIDGIRSFNNTLRTSGTEAGDITANGPAAFVRVRDAYTGQPAYNTNASTIESF